MYLGRYSFAGDPQQLQAAYRRLRTAYPPSTAELHVAVLRADGLDVYDACPDAETLRAFSTSAEFRAAISAAGLPEPDVTGCGEVLNAVVSDAVSDAVSDG